VKGSFVSPDFFVFQSMSFDSKEYIDSYEEYMETKKFDSYESMGYMRRGDTLQ
jgi:hypothetical protein